MDWVIQDQQIAMFRKQGIIETFDLATEKSIKYPTKLNKAVKGFHSLKSDSTDPHVLSI